MLDNLKRLFLGKKVKKRDAYTWNMVQSILISFQSAILLMVINRTNDLNSAGVFSIAYAVASLIYYLGEYGVRKFQVTDVNEQVSFSEYYTHRVMTCAIAFIATIIYTGAGIYSGRFDAFKAQIILIVCIVKIIEAYCDVYFARFQQCGRLDVAAKASTYRVALPVLLCICCLVITHNMLISMWIWLIANVFAFYTSFKLIAPEFGTARLVAHKQSLIMITRTCLPLFLGNFLLLYIGNAPKYAIDSIMSNEDQARFNFLFMPVFVIGMLANFVFNPILAELAADWSAGNYRSFYGKVIRQSVIILAITLLAVIVAMSFGCFALGVIFHSDLTGYKMHLTILMIGGGLLAFVNFLAVVITVLRGQRFLMIGYCISAAAAGLFSEIIVKEYGLTGACVLYTMLMLFVTVAFLVIFLIYNKMSRTKEGRRAS